MAWCEAEDVDYVFGLARNQRLERCIEKALRKSRRRSMTTGVASRRFREFRHRTLSSWSRSRRVVGKAEWLQKGRNPRFAVTSLPSSRFGKKALYEELYCARGDMENRIKEQQLDLFADRTSTATMAGNQMRLYWASFAYVLMAAMRRFALAGTPLARAQCGTIRLKLLKVAAQLRITHRRIWLALPSAFPWQSDFAAALDNLRKKTAVPPGRMSRSALPDLQDLPPERPTRSKCALNHGLEPPERPINPPDHRADLQIPPSVPERSPRQPHWTLRLPRYPSDRPDQTTR